MCNRYILDFKDSQFNNLKDCIATENWVRLPLPDNYEVKEFNELLVDYPKNIQKHIRIFETHFSGKIQNYKSENVFSQFLEGNPFDSIELMTQSKMVSPDKVIYT